MLNCCARYGYFFYRLRKSGVSEQCSQTSVAVWGVSFIQLQPPAERTRHAIPPWRPNALQGRRSGPPMLMRCREKKPLPSAQRIEETTPRRGLFRFGASFGLGAESAPIAESAHGIGFALLGESLFLVWPRKSNQKEGHPSIRVLLRKTSLPPALLRGASRRDIHVPSLLARHPCLASPCSAPTLGLLKGLGSESSENSKIDTGSLRYVCY